MDPITLASRRFVTEWEAFWRPPPGREVPGPRALRLAFSLSERSNVLKSLKLMEWSPQNRRPFVIVEEPVRDRVSYARAVVSKLCEDLTKVSKGLAEDAVTMRTLEKPDEAADPRSVTRSARDAVAEVLDGLVLALLPASIDDPEAFAEIVTALAAESNGTTLRVAVADAEDLRELLPAVATFAVDEAALLRYLKELGRTSKKAPPIERPAVTAAAKERLAQQGKTFPSEATAIDFRGLLLDGADAMKSGDIKRALKKFRAARMLCRLTGLKEEEAATSIGLGSIVFATGDVKGAVFAFRRGRELAESIGSAAMAAQAELGVAATLFAAKDWTGARASYVEVQRLAEGIPQLVIESTRMEGECLRLAGDADGAAATFAKTLEVAARLPPEARAASSSQHAARGLSELVGVERARRVEEHIAARVAHELEEQP